MGKFLQSGYDIDGLKYYSFEQIGEYLFPEKCPADAYAKIRYIYKYRRSELEKYSRKTKSWWSGQTIVVLNLEGLKKLSAFIKDPEKQEKLGKITNCTNFSI